MRNGDGGQSYRYGIGTAEVVILKKTGRPERRPEKEELEKNLFLVQRPCLVLSMK